MLVVLVLNLMKDGVVTEQDFQALCAKMCVLTFLLRLYSYILSTPAS